jgi:hypothetical protein
MPGVNMPCVILLSVIVSIVNTPIVVMSSVVMTIVIIQLVMALITDNLFKKTKNKNLVNRRSTTTNLRIGASQAKTYTTK